MEGNNRGDLAIHIAQRNIPRGFGHRSRLPVFNSVAGIWHDSRQDEAPQLKIVAGIR
jgi:hypothetical protein